ALESTSEIASRCTVVLPKAKRLRYPTNGVPANKLVWDWLREGWHYRISQGNTHIVPNTKDYVARLKSEMGQIEAKDFVHYMLFLSDIVRFAKNRGIPVG